MMTKNKKYSISQKGFTLTEMTTALAISSIVVLAIGAILADSQRSFNRMYDKIFSDINSAGIVASKTFETTVRKAKGTTLQLGQNPSSIEVCYYQDLNQTSPDRYARLYHSNNKLYIEYGRLNPKETLQTEIVCGNVSACVFLHTGQSAQMILTLDDGSRSLVMTSSAVMNN